MTSLPTKWFATFRRTRAWRSDSAASTGLGMATLDGRCPPKAAIHTQDRLATARENTLKLLLQLPQLPSSADSPEAVRYDASPKLALGDLRNLAHLPCEVSDAYSPAPTMLDATEILLDALARSTSIRERMPGRPPVAPYLHGVPEWEPPESYVAWREEVDLVSGELLEGYPPDDLLDYYPLKPRELLRDRSAAGF